MMAGFLSGTALRLEQLAVHRDAIRRFKDHLLRHDKLLLREILWDEALGQHLQAPFPERYHRRKRRPPRRSGYQREGGAIARYNRRPLQPVSLRQHLYRRLVYRHARHMATVYI